MKSYNSKIIPVLRDMTDKLYIADIDKCTPVKFPDDTVVRKLVKQYRDTGDISARNSIIESFGRYVVSIAKNYQEQGLPLSDLISEGMIGLIAAIEQFDTEQTTKFVTYSNVSISRQMKEALDQFNRPVKVPKNIRNSQMKIRERVHNEQLTGKDLPEIIQDIEDDVDQEFALNPRMYQRLVLNTRDDEEDDDPMENSMLLSESSSPMSTADLRQDLERVFTKLSENEVKVIRAFYGFSGDYLKSSIKLVGESLNMTPEQVRKLKLSGLQKLRDEKSKKILAKYL